MSNGVRNAGVNDNLFYDELLQGLQSNLQGGHGFAPGAESFILNVSGFGAETGGSDHEEFLRVLQDLQSNLQGVTRLAPRAETISLDRAGFGAELGEFDDDYECCKKFVKVAIITSKYVAVILASILAIALFPITISIIAGVACACEEDGSELAAITNIFCSWLNDCTTCEINFDESERNSSVRAPQPRDLGRFDESERNSSVRAPQATDVTHPNRLEKNPSQKDLTIEFPKNQQVYVPKEEDDEKTTEFCTFFNQTYRDVSLNELSAYPFEDLFVGVNSFFDPIQNPCQYFTDIPLEDFVDISGGNGKEPVNGPQVREDLISHRRWQALASHTTVESELLSKFYVNTIFNTLRFLKSIENTPGVQDGLSKYRETFTNVVKRMYETFSDGCAFNQISHLRSIIADILYENIPIGVHMGFNKETVVFSLALYIYQSAQIKELTAKVFTQPQFRSIFQNHEYYNGEGVELEYVVLREMQLIQAKFKAHFFEGAQAKPMIDWVISEFWKIHKPLSFFYEMLKQKPEAGFITANFHRQICDWYNEQGFDITSDEHAFLRKEGSESYDYWLSEQAVVYYFMKNGFLKATN